MKIITLDKNFDASIKISYIHKGKKKRSVKARFNYEKRLKSLTEVLP